MGIHNINQIVCSQHIFAPCDMRRTFGTKFTSVEKKAYSQICAVICRGTHRTENPHNTWDTATPWQRWTLKTKRKIRYGHLHHLTETQPSVLQNLWSSAVCTEAPPTIVLIQPAGKKTKTKQKTEYRRSNRNQYVHGGRCPSRYAYRIHWHTRGRQYHSSKEWQECGGIYQERPKRNYISTPRS